MKIFQQKIGLLTLPSKMHLCMTFWKAFLKRKWRFLHQVWEETAIREACLPVYPVIERTLVAQFPLSSFPSSLFPFSFAFSSNRFFFCLIVDILLSHINQKVILFSWSLPEISTSVFFFLRCRVCVKQQNKKAIQLLAHLSEILTCNLQPAVYTVRVNVSGRVQ